jgi:hypothetical protein
MAVDGVPVEKWVSHLVVKKPTAVAYSLFPFTEIMPEIGARRASWERDICSDIQSNGSVFNCAFSVRSFSSLPVQFQGMCVCLFMLTVLFV